MLRIGKLDIAYGVKQCEIVDSGGSRGKKLDWETELFKNSQSFWLILLSEMTKIYKDIASALRSESSKKLDIALPRSALTFVYAPVYSAYGSRLPYCRASTYFKVKAFCENLGDAESEIFEDMDCMNPVWSEAFEAIMFSYRDMPQSRQILLALTKTLLDETKNAMSEAQNNDESSDRNINDDDNDDNDDDDDNGNASRQLPVPVEDKSKDDEDPIDFDQIGGQAEAKEVMINLVVALQNPKLYKRWGTRPPRGIALHGPPGTGKTLLARALAARAKTPFYYIDTSDLGSHLFSVSENRLKAVFSKVRKTGGIIFFDEADALAPSRDRVFVHEVDVRMIAVLNRQMDGFTPLHRVVVIFATNKIDRMDQAVLRAGRVDLKIKMSLPDENGRADIFQIHMRKAEKIAGRKLFDPTVSPKQLAAKISNWSGADIAEVVRRVLAQKVCDEFTGGKSGEVTMADFFTQIEKYETSEEFLDNSKAVGFKVTDNL